MRNSKNIEKSDLEECRDKIRKILDEYNCRIYSCDDYSGIYILDQDTQETEGGINPRRSFWDD